MSHLDDRVNTDLVEFEFPCVGPPFAVPLSVTLDLAGDGRRESRGGFPFPSPRPRPLLDWLFIPMFAPFPEPACRDPLGVIV